MKVGYSHIYLILSVLLSQLHLHGSDFASRATLPPLPTPLSPSTKSRNVGPTNDTCTVKNETSSILKSGYKIFSEEQHKKFYNDGFIVVSDLLDDDMLDDFVGAGDSFVSHATKLKAYFSTLEMGMIFGDTATFDPDITKKFRKVALESILPRAVAELMNLPTTHNVRVLRDIFMSKPVEQNIICDWHVDDQGFWPESFVSEQNGINVWIAMEDMPAIYQGSMALSPKSHHADDWRFQAYEAIGQNRASDGGFTKAEAKRRADAGERFLTTCEMHHQAPALRELIEDTIYIPDIKKGDVIFADRLLFHRTTQVTEGGKKFYHDRGIEYLNRYSIRYVPGTARLPSGWNFEWSVVTNTENEGKTLDDVAEDDGRVWYPKVWPNVDEDLHGQLDELGMTTIEGAKAQAKAEFFELIALFTPRK